MIEMMRKSAEKQHTLCSTSLTNYSLGMAFSNTGCIVTNT